MSSLPPSAVRGEVTAALDAIDAAQHRLRAVSTDLVGNAFRVELADRLEVQRRVTAGLSYRVFGELADPPDGPGDPGLPAEVKLVDVLRRRLRITSGEVRRRMAVARRIRPRRSLTGAPVPAELPELGAAVEQGAVGADHVQEVLGALKLLRHNVSAADRAMVEATLVSHARVQDANFVTSLGRKVAEMLNPDGIFDEKDRENRRALVLGKQGADGMSKLSGYLRPAARAALEAVEAAVRPGHHLPDSDVPDADVPDADGPADPRTKSQRLHDAFEWGLGAAMSAGKLGTHRGLPVTIIATTTVADLEQAAAAAADPALPMPAPARTGGGSVLPMRDVIRMAAGGALHYLVVFENHSARPLYLGRSQRLASADQRILCYARDRGCTHPDCGVPGSHCEVHHALDWAAGGGTDADNLFFACGPANRGASDGTYTTTVTEEGRLGWTDGTGPPEVNRRHHPEELLRDGDP